jgi:myo-inositol-1(or 4)-monophosphatase
MCFIRISTCVACVANLLMISFIKSAFFMTEQIKNLYNTAVSAANDAGSYLRNKTNLAIDESTDKDIKLAADKQSEHIILTRLKETNLAILSEEAGLIESNLNNEYYWIVDPLDGSVNYLKGMDELTCISIALFKHGVDSEEPVFGIIYRWKADELFSGVVGEGAMLNGAVIKTSDVQKCTKAVFATGLPNARDFSKKALEKFAGDFARFKKIRMLGAAAVMGVFVACGRVDAYFEEDIRLWDVAAVAAIVNAAGGVFSLEIKKESGSNYQCNFGAFATNELRTDFFDKA